MRWVVLLFVLVPLVELYLLLRLAALIHFWPTIALVVVTGLAGGVLAKMEGLRVLRAWRHAFETMTPPEQGVLDGVLVLVGGALLVTPGVLTDLAGLLMLIPYSRRLIAGYLRTVVDRSIASRRLHVVTAAGNGPFVTVGPNRPPSSGTRPLREVVETTGEVTRD